MTDDREETQTPANDKPKKQIQILLCGCGNAVHVLVGYVASQQSTEYEFKVNVLSSHADRLLDSLPNDGRIQCVKQDDENKENISATKPYGSPQ